jgi:GeoRSP system SPASM domain protein
MAIDSLDTPLRVTWDLCSPGLTASADNALQVSARLAEAQLFYVTLEQTPLLHPVFKDVVSQLSAAGCQLLIVSLGSESELEALSDVPAGATVLFEVDTFVRTESVDIARLEQGCSRLREAGLNYGLSLTPARQNLNQIGTLIQFCLQQNIPRFKLPNKRINDNFSAADHRELLRPRDIELFRQLADDFPDFKTALQLDVHDLFLWEILFPEGGVARSEYGGCQAANSLAHIDVNGIVHPCVSWPHRLGSLVEDSFYAIWQAPRRQEVRSAIAATPRGCQQCRDYAICFAGCRGLSRLDESCHGRDLMCAGQRS